MSPLTKIFVVLHVVMSLVLAAGLIVFVNRTDNFRVAAASQTAELNRTRAEKASANSEALLQSGYATAARSARDAAIMDGQKSLAAAQTQIASLSGQLADAQSSAKIAMVTQDNLTAALNASETSRKAMSDIVDSTRTENNTLTTKYSQSQLAISDLTNKLEVAQRHVTDYSETIAENKTKIENLEKLAKDAGISPTTPAGLAAGAPPINAVVRSTQPINGIPYATISVGSDAQVKAGMKFDVIDRDKGSFLGELTIEQVDAKEATGKLEGPHISDIHTGTEVKTQT